MRALLWALLLGGCGTGNATPFGIVYAAPALGGPRGYVWVSDDKSVYLVGQDPANGAAMLAVSHNDAIDWGQADITTATAFSGVFGFSALDVWVTGPGLVLHTTDGSHFKAVGTGLTSAMPGAIWGPQVDNVYVAADIGLIHTTDGGTTWGTVIATAIAAVWGSGPTDVYAVDGAGKIWHSTDGIGFTAFATSGGAPLGWVGGSGAHDVFAGGANGNVFHSTDGDGATWTAVATPPESAQAIWAAPNGDVYVVGDLGVWHTANGGLSADTSTAPTGGAIAGNALGDVYIVGSGRLYHKAR
jgi:hypothetical protein